MTTSQPDWSPDGKRIVFTRGSPGRLFVMDADGAGAHRVTKEEVDETEPAWSPDGRWIAYSRREPGSSIRELWLVRPDGSERRQLTKLGGVAQGPSWSPDGRRIAFSANVDKGFDIYTVGADGKGVQPGDVGRRLIRAGLVARTARPSPSRKREPSSRSTSRTVRKRR